MEGSVIRTMSITPYTPPSAPTARTRARRRALVCALAWALAGQVVLAAPSQNGSTGFLQIPTADVTGLGQMTVGLHLAAPPEDGSDPSEGFATLSYGLASGIEVGVGTRAVSGGESFDAWPILKAQLVPETRDDPALAIGLEDDAIYGVVTKTSAPGLRWAIGIGNGRFNALFGGVSVTLNPVNVSSAGRPLPIVRLLAEYDGRDFNIGARLEAPPGLMFVVGITDVAGIERPLFGASLTTGF
ncbi:MAG TPA: hypothetical protein VF234_06365 [Limnochordia bacterium]